MTDFSRPFDKNDPVVLAEWSVDLRRGVAEEGVHQCEAYRWILDLCDKADAALSLAHIGRAGGYLGEAAYHWYRANING